MLCPSLRESVRAGNGMKLVNKLVRVIVIGVYDVCLAVWAVHYYLWATIIEIYDRKSIGYGLCMKTRSYSSRSRSSTIRDVRVWDLMSFVS